MHFFSADENEDNCISLRADPPDGRLILLQSDANFGEYNVFMYVGLCTPM